MTRTRHLAAAAFTVVLTGALIITAASCGGSESADTTAPTDTTTSITSTTSASSDSTPPAGNDGGSRLVATPEGEVVCSITAQSARCDVPESDWRQFLDTVDECDSAPFASLTIDATGRTVGTCAIGGLTGSPEPLADGASVAAGDLTCTNESGIVRCSAAGAGGQPSGAFTVNRSGYSIL